MGNTYIAHRVAAIHSFERKPGRIVLCGSMTFFADMVRIQEHFDRLRIPTSLPDVEDERVVAMSADEYERFKRRVSLAHLRRVRRRLTIGILVLNLDKRGVPDYIGPSTFAEIAMATAFSKRVYLLGRYPELYADELAAWGVVALDGRLDRLVEDYWARCLPERQMRLFGRD